MNNKRSSSSSSSSTSSEPSVKKYKKTSNNNNSQDVKEECDRCGKSFNNSNALEGHKGGCDTAAREAAAAAAAAAAAEKTLNARLNARNRKRASRAAKRAANPPVKRIPVKWKEPEKAALEAGVRKYFRHWVAIKAEFADELVNRTPEDLRDKWENMKKVEYIHVVETEEMRTNYAKYQNRRKEEALKLRNSTKKSSSSSFTHEPCKKCGRKCQNPGAQTQHNKHCKGQQKSSSSSSSSSSSTSSSTAVYMSYWNDYLRTFLIEEIRSYYSQLEIKNRKELQNLQNDGQAPRSLAKEEFRVYVDTLYEFFLTKNKDLITWIQESRSAAEVTLQIYENLTTFNTKVVNQPDIMLPQRPMDINTWLGLVLSRI